MTTLADNLMKVWQMAIVGRVPGTCLGTCLYRYSMLAGTTDSNFRSSTTFSRSKVLAENWGGAGLVRNKSSLFSVGLGGNGGV